MNNKGVARDGVGVTVFFNIHVILTRPATSKKSPQDFFLKKKSSQQLDLYSPGPVPAGLAHRMRIYSNPLKNDLIQHTFKINFTFVEKFPVIP